MSQIALSVAVGTLAFLFVITYIGMRAVDALNGRVTRATNAAASVRSDHDAYAGIWGKQFDQIAKDIGALRDADEGIGATIELLSEQVRELEDKRQVSKALYDLTAVLRSMLETPSASIIDQLGDTDVPDAVQTVDAPIGGIGGRTDVAASGATGGELSAPTGHVATANPSGEPGGATIQFLPPASAMPYDPQRKVLY